MADPFGAPARRFPLWARWVVLVEVLALVAVGAVLVARHLAPEPPIEVRVQAGSVDQLVEVPEGATVAEALAEAGVRPHDGVLRAVVSGDVIDDQHDPATFTRSGFPAALDTVVLDHDTVVAVDGQDEVEDTEVVTEPIEPAPYPESLRHVHEISAPGERERERGVTSGEEVRTTVLREPRNPQQTTRKVVALTFDDGPTEQWTPQVLDYLDTQGVKATFCTVGTNARRSPDLVREVVKRGHQLCNHTVSHATDLVGAPQTRLDEEIGGGAAAITEAGVDPAPYYRPPGGFLSDEIVATARGLGEVALYWKADPQDWRSGTTAEQIILTVLAQVDDGAIILLHDGGGQSREQTLIALKFLVPLLRGRGYEFTFPLVEPGP